MNSVQPLVSVIIPCFNHGKYLAAAIESVHAQTYCFYEVIVVDDGSIDDTREVCERRPDVTYVYQENAGLSAARNTGIKWAKGDLFVFLDADDWLVDRALEININILKNNGAAAFVSGGFEIFYEREQETSTFGREIKEDHYVKLLEGNFIGMHGAVMYRSWVFEQFLFNTSLRYSEDYDMYLRVSRLYPIIHHTNVVAVYRQHGKNMSANIPEMLEAVLKVLSFQQPNIRTKQEQQAYNFGKRNWRNYYSQKLYEQLSRQPASLENKSGESELATLRAINYPLYKKFTRERQGFTGPTTKQQIKKILKKISPMTLRNLFREKIKHHRLRKFFRRKIDLGSLNRTTPFSTQFGYDRGGPIDRYYIENFLSDNAAVVKGRILEVGDNEYTLRFGTNKIIKSDILHIDDTNPQATFVGDLSNAPHLPSDAFDCIILTQTLHLIYDYKGAIEACYRVLKPGGSLLLTVPGISHIAQDGWGKYWLWSFTDASMKRIMEEHFPAGKISINTHGNVLAATTFLYGMGLPEVKKKQLDVHDPHYQVIVTVHAVK